MKMRNLLNNSGFSLVFALAALGIITGTTAYLLGIKKSDVKQSSTARATSLIEFERSRISAALSDNTICLQVFGGQNSVRNNIASLVTTTPAAVLVASNTTYYNKILRVSSINTRTANAGEFAGLTAGTDKNYVLEIQYLDNTVDRSGYTGKKSSSIYIPMYMKGGASVTECYSLALNNEINVAVKDSCSPNTVATSKNSLLGSTGAVQGTDCTHSATFASAAPENTTCIDNTTLPITQTNAIIGFDLTGSNALDFPQSKCQGIATSCAAFGASIWSITNSIPACGTPGMNRSTPCGAGQVLYKNGASNYTCITVNCPATFFLQAVNSTGGVCIQAPTTTCAANEYVKDYNAAGVGQCAPLPIMTGSCGVNQFGASLTRAFAGNNGTLNCLPTFAKQCAAPSRTVFVTSFNDIQNANCTIP